MVGTTDSVDSSASNNKKNRIQVSNTQKPLFFYVYHLISPRFLHIVLSPAVASTVVTIAEILKNKGLAIEKRIMTSTIDMREESGGRPVQKAKIEILLGKSEKFDELMAAAAEEALDNE